MWRDKMSKTPKNPLFETFTYKFSIKCAWKWHVSTKKIHHNLRRSLKKLNSYKVFLKCKLYWIMVDRPSTDTSSVCKKIERKCWLPSSFFDPFPLDLGLKVGSPNYPLQYPQTHSDPTSSSYREPRRRGSVTPKTGSATSKIIDSKPYYPHCRMTWCN